MNWDEIKAEVEKNGDVQTVTMDTLRDANGAGKLGVHVREDIARKLAGMGLGHIPQDLPSYQHEYVRLYKRGTAVGELIEKVLTPGPANDQFLAEKLGGATPDYAAIVAKIRDLVAE